MSKMNIELLKPFSNDGISMFMLLFRKDKSWGFVKKENCDYSLPWYVCPEDSCESSVENSIMGIVFRETGAFQFDTKPLFDVELQINEREKISKGRIYIVELYGASVKDNVHFFKSADLPEKIEDRDFVEELLASADVIANIYF